MSQNRVRTKQQFPVILDSTRVEATCWLTSLELPSNSLYPIISDCLSALVQKQYKVSIAVETEVSAPESKHLELIS